MARYRKIEVAVWRDERFVSLSAPQPNAQTLWLYLLSGPRTTTFPGLIVAREAVMADDLGWSVEALREALREALFQGLIEVDAKAGLVVLQKALFDSSGDPRETAKPESPNVIRSWAKSWDDVPDCDLKRRYLHTLGNFAASLGETFGQAFREGFRKALGKPTPNQDQDSGSGLRIRKEDSDTASQVGVRRPISKRGRRSKNDPTPDERASAMVVLERLGSRNGVKYSGSTEHVRLIANLLRQGVPEADLRKVVKYCAEKLEWQDDLEMGKYLRPETLFGPKTYAKYLDPARTWFDSLPEEDRAFAVVPALEIVR